MIAGHAPAASVEDSAFTLRPGKTTTSPTIDGSIEEAEWEAAAVADGFIQYQPSLGSPSVVRSQALVMYDDGHLYVAFRLFDSQPPTAQLTRRDSDLEDDDAVVIVLDSHHDNRTAFYFMTNPLGTQTDGQVTNDGRTVDATWDAAWQSAARIDDLGWTAEFEIPFTSISYVAGEDETWGINLGRSRRRNLEYSYWAGPLDAPFRVSQGGTLTGLNIPAPERRYRVIPYGLSRLQEDRHADWQAGVDMRYALTPEMAGYLTLNPDFATIEADQERINLTRFEIALTEKRPFFLESAQQFRQRIRTFYTRRIVDVSVGGQFLGRQGPWTFTGVATRSQFPVEPPEVESPPATYLVGRAQRDVFGSSNVAVMAANRSLEGVNQGSASVDATLFFTKTLGMTAQAAQSWGLFEAGTQAFFVRPAYDSPVTHFHVRYTHLGEHVAENINAIGFIRDDNRRELDSALEHTFWIDSGAIEQIEYDSNYNIYWGVRGTLRSWQIDQGLDIQLRNRLSMEVAFREEFKRFEKDFQNREVGVEIGYNTREFQSAQVGYAAGRNFDLDFQLWTALERLVLRPDPENESTWIHVLRVDQFFTKDLFVKLFYQTNSAIDRRNIQVVSVYRYRPPFGTIQLAYQRGTAEFGERSRQGNTFFFKVTAVF
jgi:hypothetical protein